jgi:hypothetical protein
MRYLILAYTNTEYRFYRDQLRNHYGLASQNFREMRGLEDMRGYKGQNATLVLAGHWYENADCVDIITEAIKHDTPVVKVEDML